MGDKSQDDKIEPSDLGKIASKDQRYTDNVKEKIITLERLIQDLETFINNLELSDKKTLKVVLKQIQKQDHRFEFLRG